jgi:hypothetical protein
VDGSRPGVFWSVVNDPTQYGSTGMVTLFLHEGQPGHHFHIALMQELGLPNFRKFGGNNAFTEGWALYAETLGKEMGLFDKPEDYFGHLNDEMLRAVRLVVDTGMHAKGWTREQSIQYMRETLGYTEAIARNARPSATWHGRAQALGYKIGSLKIQELRPARKPRWARSSACRSSTRSCWGEGTLPLALLEKKVDRWIAASSKIPSFPREPILSNRNPYVGNTTSVLSTYRSNSQHGSPRARGIDGITSPARSATPRRRRHRPPAAPHPPPPSPPPDGPRRRGRSAPCRS